jgi:hypothetical protein
VQRNRAIDHIVQPNRADKMHIEDIGRCVRTDQRVANVTLLKLFSLGRKTMSVEEVGVLLALTFIYISTCCDDNNRI